MNISNEKIINSQHSVQVGSKHYAVNRKGYLIDFDDWDKSFTKRVAEIDHLKLTGPHWEAINFLRDYYREYEVAPSPHIVIKRMGDKINSFGCTQHDINRAFPLGGCKQSCRITITLLLFLLKTSPLWCHLLFLVISKELHLIIQSKTRVRIQKRTPDWGTVSLFSSKHSIKVTPNCFILL